MGRILLIDDDDGVLRSYSMVLRKGGFEVETASDGATALARIRENEFDVVVSDISMPKLSGLDLLKAIRERDLDVPVILVTGGPALETAMQAVEYGAFRYLSKPIEPEALREVVLRAMRLHQMAKLKRQALSMLGGDGLLLGDRAALEARFSNALDKLWVAFQPIVSLKKKKIFGYEALLRSNEPTLARPSDILQAAERLGRLRELSRSIRRHVAEAIGQAPEGVLLFTNIQSQDLDDDDLYAADAPLTQHASRVVLEVTERASLDGIKDARGRAAQLRELGFRIAVDDLGAGYAGLSSFAILDPDVVKLDMSLVRGIDLDPRKRTVVRSMVKLAADLEMLVIPEGIETPGEREALLELGCDLFQGFLFARPEKGFVIPEGLTGA